MSETLKEKIVRLNEAYLSAANRVFEKTMARDLAEKERKAAFEEFKGADAVLNEVQREAEVDSKKTHA